MSRETKTSARSSPPYLLLSERGFFFFNLSKREREKERDGERERENWLCVCYMGGREKAAKEICTKPNRGGAKEIWGSTFEVGSVNFNHLKTVSPTLLLVYHKDVPRFCFVFSYPCLRLSI